MEVTVFHRTEEAFLNEHILHLDMQAMVLGILTLDRTLILLFLPLIDAVFAVGRETLVALQRLSEDLHTDVAREEVELLLHFS